MSELRLVIFDVDGTLVDSQDLIQQAMVFAYDQIGVPAPARDLTLSYVGMSLDLIFQHLSPDLSDAQHAALSQGYRDAYFHMRQQQGSALTSPFFAGMRGVLDGLHAQDTTILAVATGKSKRGLDKLISGHGLEGYFQSLQVADFHPSKPHPAMIQACLTETGIAPARTVMIGDTSFDIDMGRAAGVHTIAVSWGYHDAVSLAADRVVTDPSDIMTTIDQLIGSDA
jgi:phosphoglycolate phosphatase